jgi:hypothetical protein
MALLQETLRQFKEDDYTVKLVSTIFNIIPMEKSYVFYNEFENGLRRIKPSLTEEDLQKAYQFLDDPKIQSTLKAFIYVDTTDKLISSFAGIKNVLNLFGMGSNQKRTFESDPEQALDAAVKALVIAYAVNRLYSGDLKSKMQELIQTPAGIELLIYYSLIEIALPFTDNLVESSSKVISKLLENKHQIENKFNTLGIGKLENTTELLNAFQNIIPNYLDRVKNYIQPVAEKIKVYLPTALNIADSATGVIASGADLLPVWSFLGARLITESIALKLKNDF